VYKKINRVAILSAVLWTAWGGPSSATLAALPKALKSPLDRMAMTTPSWGALSYNFSCIERLDECQGQPKKASLFALPKALKPQLDRVPLAAQALPPMAHSVFCHQYPKDCEVHKIAFRPRKLQLTPGRWQDLVAVNAKVNRSIRPERNLLGLAGEKWLIAPASGDCNDYAVTKQHELLARGWPSRSLLLAEVVTHWGEHHLILVVRTGKGDVVLDNMNANIRPWSKVPYRWVRVQSPRNPKAWLTVQSTNV
jgi:predicted transglutaminase-like cysteine proteinase